MSGILVVVEQSHGHIKKASLAALGASRTLAGRIGGQVSALVLGCGVEPVATELADLGVQVKLADAPVLQHYLAESFAVVVAEAARADGATWIIAAATAQGKDLLPRAATKLGAACATNVVAIAGEGATVLLRRPMWAGSVIAEVELTTPVKAFTVRASEFPAAKKEGSGSVTRVAVSLDGTTLRTRFVEFDEVKSTRPDLTEARIVVSGGRGTKGDFKQIEGLADDLGGAVGASRAAVDAGWVPNDWQVGQTGKVVAPEVYIAAGISGSLQHLAGMKGSKVIIAINNDPEAPIFQVADYGLVADLFEAIPELRKKITAQA